MSLGAELQHSPQPEPQRGGFSDLVDTWTARPASAERIAGWRWQAAAHQPTEGRTRCRRCGAPAPCPWRTVALAALAAQTQRKGRPADQSPPGGQ